MQKIVPNIWCNRTAEEAGAFYAEALPATSSEVEGRYPSEGLPDFQRDFAGEPLTVAVQIAGTRITLINAGDEFRPNPGISFVLNFDPLMFAGAAHGAEEAARASLDASWEALGAGGTVRMPLQEYDFSPHYGWVEDRFGVSWQLMLTNPAGDPRPFVVPALMFDGTAQDRAAAAADFYVSLFENVPGGAAVGNRYPYGAPMGKAGADGLAYGEFRVGEQWFMAADNGSGVDHGLVPAVSLEAQCEDQAEIDRLWDALSASPEAEQCGWLQDRYGVSWQIVPKNMGELMERPNAYEHMMGMKKLVISEF